MTAAGRAGNAVSALRASARMGYGNPYDVRSAAPLLDLDEEAYLSDAILRARSAMAQQQYGGNLRGDASPMREAMLKQMASSITALEKQRERIIRERESRTAKHGIDSATAAAAVANANATSAATANANANAKTAHVSATDADEPSS